MPSTFDTDSMTMLIRKLESITALSDEERGAIEDLPARIRTLQAGQDIVRDGDKPSQCGLILEGWTCRYKLLGEGRRQIFSFHVPGDTPDQQSLHLPIMDHRQADQHGDEEAVREDKAAFLILTTRCNLVSIRTSPR